MSTSQLALLACVLVASACHHRRSGSSPSDGSVLGDGSASEDSGSVVTVPCDTTHPCAVGQYCSQAGYCVDNGACQTDDDCEDDTRCQCESDMSPCVDGMCVAWGTPPDDPTCMTAGFASTLFMPPVVKCHWPTMSTTAQTGVIMTPLVVDLDKDGKPEIVFNTQYPIQMVAIHGDTCEQIWAHPLTGFGYEDTQLAAADFDGDGYPEIVALANSSVIVFDHTGTQLASGALTENVSQSSGGPAIANVDNMGPPEIGVHGAVLRYTPGSPSLTVLFEHDEPATPLGLVSLFADMDGDNKPELVTGIHVYDGVTGLDKTPSNLAALASKGPGYPQIADFNLDGKPDIALIQPTKSARTVTVFDYANNKVIFGPYTVMESMSEGCGASSFAGGCAGTATIGDFDGDGVPDIGFASSDEYHVYALKCATTPKPADCIGSEMGELWSKPTQDLTSGGTASSTFDFNGDGVPEAVYRDECFLRVYNGHDGSLLFAQSITSGTLLEYPTIADVDNDGHADIVVPSDNNLQSGSSGSYCAPDTDPGQTFTGFTSGVFVLSDPMNRWMPSRSLWTEHTYHITDIDDSLAPPLIETPSWTTSNSYRKNVQGSGKAGPAPDYTGGNDSTSPCSERTPTLLTANICNRGATSAAAGVPGTFYSGDPRQPGAKVLCSVATTMTLAAGACVAVSCAPLPPLTGSPDIWFRADDNGTTASAKPECNAGNDLLHLPSCGKIQ